MTIIEHGNTHKKYRCPTCDCLVEINKVDTFTRSNGNAMLGRPATVIRTYFKCPECGSQVMIKKEKK